MTICPNDQHRWGPWTAPVPGSVHLGNEILAHPGVMAGIPIDYLPAAQRWQRECTACGSRQQAQPTAPRADVGPTCHPIAKKAINDWKTA